MHYRPTIKLITIIIMILSISCSEEKDCIEYSANKGAIVREIDMGECYGIMSVPFILITDTVQYKNLRLLTSDTLLSQMGCSSTPHLPTIDFEKYSLAGVLTIGNGCNVNYEREINIDSINKVVHYNIIVHQCGDCNDKRLNMNWVTLTKVDSFYELEPLISHHK